MTYTYRRQTRHRARAVYRPLQRRPIRCLAGARYWQSLGAQDDAQGRDSAKGRPKIDCPRSEVLQGLIVLAPPTHQRGVAAAFARPTILASSQLSASRNQTCAMWSRAFRDWWF
jgi:hypothetical protein